MQLFFSFSLALNLDPKNAKATEGLQKIEHSSEGNHDMNNYDLAMEELHSDDAELEESETEGGWSDGDLNLATAASSSRYL